MVPLQDLTVGLLGEVIRRQPHSRERTAFAWQLAVGPALARSTTVELDGTVLKVRPRTRQWATEIDRAADTIVKRMQHLLGPRAVTEIEIASTDQ